MSVQEQVLEVTLIQKLSCFLASLLTRVDVDSITLRSFELRTFCLVTCKFEYNLVSQWLLHPYLVKSGTNFIYY